MFDESTERDAILRLCRDLQDAWNRGDATGYAAQFSADASFVAWTGMHGYGSPAIRAAHQPLLDGPLAGSRLLMVDNSDNGDNGTDSPRPESLRFIRPDVAIMVTSGLVALTDQRASTPAHESVQTIVLVKTGARWQITAFQNTRRHAS